MPTIREIPFTREETNFVPVEISDMLYHVTGRRPSTVNWLTITWFLDEHNKRNIRFQCGDTNHIIPVNVHHAEDPGHAAKWLQSDSNAFALFDIKRTIACELTVYHKQQIASFWER